MFPLTSLRLATIVTVAIIGTCVTLAQPTEPAPTQPSPESRLGHSDTLAGEVVAGSMVASDEQDVTSATDTNGNHDISDPSQSRLFICPTGRPLDAGRGYASLSALVFPMVAIGFTDYLSIAGGCSIIPGASEQLVYMNVKATPLTTPSLALSAGTIYFAFVGDDGSDIAAGIAYAVGSYCTEKISATIGLGVPYSRHEVPTSIALMAGFEAWISGSMRILSENYVIPGDELGLISLGLRFFDEPFSIDVGLFTTTENPDQYPVAPWISFAYNF